MCCLWHDLERSEKEPGQDACWFEQQIRCQGLFQSHWIFVVNPCFFCRASSSLWPWMEITWMSTKMRITISKQRCTSRLHNAIKWKFRGLFFFNLTWNHWNTLVKGYCFGIQTFGWIWKEQLKSNGIFFFFFVLSFTRAPSYDELSHKTIQWWILSAGWTLGILQTCGNTPPTTPEWTNGSRRKAAWWARLK